MKKSREEIQWELSQQIMNNNSYCVANIAPRTGKCKISLDTILTSESVLIVYPSVNIKQSWKDDLVKWKVKNKKRFKFSTYLSFKKIRDNYDVLILDECHNISQKQFKTISDYIKLTGIKKVIGLSGSLNEDSKLNLLNILGLKTLVNYSIQQAIDDGIISDYKITVIQTPLDTNKNIKVKWKGGEFITSEKQSFDRLSDKINDWQSYSSKQMKMMRLQRMKIIKESQAKVQLTKSVINNHIDNKALIFTGLQKVADGLGVPSYHSKTDEINKELFLEGKINHLAIVNKLTVGITFPKLDVAILNFFDSNSENTSQKIARIMNLDYENKVANIIIICSTEEVEKRWLEKTLMFFSKDKIKYIN